MQIRSHGRREYRCHQGDIDIGEMILKKETVSIMQVDRYNGTSRAAEGDEGVLMSHMSGLHEREAHLVRLRQLMKDPMYRAAARCQAIIRMRFVRDQKAFLSPSETKTNPPLLA